MSNPPSKTPNSNTPSIPDAPVTPVGQTHSASAALQVDDHQESSVISVRQIYVTHFEMKTDEGHSYLEAGAYKIIKADNEPLAQFLADAEIARGTGPQKRDVSVSYYFGSTPTSDWRPMQFITQGMLDAFEKASQEFYKKALTDNNLPQFQKLVRMGFRLPDPDLDPESYWLVGDRFNPKLVVLWGCEKLDGNKRPMPSLPLVKNSELFPNNPVTVVDKLRARLMSWEQTVQENLALIVEKQDPIGRFIARPVQDAKKEQIIGLRPLLAPDTTYPINKFRPLKKLPMREISAFERAAEAFYGKAHEDTASREEYPDVSAYERELRRNFRLPNVDKVSSKGRIAEGMEGLSNLLEEKKPKKNQKDKQQGGKKPDIHTAYWVYGRRFSLRLMVAFEGTEPNKECLCLVKDEDLNLPPGAKNASGMDTGELGLAQAPQTVADKLHKREQTILATALRIAAVFGLIGVLAFIFFQYSNVQLKPVSAQISNDPQIDAENMRNILAVTFNTVVNFGSIHSPGKSSKELPDNFALEAGDDDDNTVDTSKIRIIAIKPNKQNGRQLLISLSDAVPDNAKLKLVANGLRPVLGQPMNKNSVLTVDTRDTRPPALVNAESAIDSTCKLLIKFDEKLDPELAAEQFSIRGASAVAIESVALDDANNVVILTATSPFVISNRYTLSVHNVKDTSQKGNAVKEQEKLFVFGDHPPMIVKNGVVGGKKGQRSQHSIYVQFTKELDESSANNPANYDLGANLIVGSVALSSNKTAVEITLTNSWMSQKPRYTLRFHDVKDPTGNIGDGKADFAYQGEMDIVSPTLKGNPEALSRNQIRLIFSKPVIGVAPADTNMFALAQALEGSGGKPIGHPSRIDQPRPDTILLTFASSLNRQSYYTLSWANIKDDVGNPTPSNVSEKFPGSHLIKKPKIYIQERRGSVLHLTAVAYDNGFDRESFSERKFTVIVTDLNTRESRKYVVKQFIEDFANKRGEENGKEDRYDSQFALTLDGALPERVNIHVEWASTVENNSYNLTTDFSPN